VAQVGAGAHRFGPKGMKGEMPTTEWARIDEIVKTLPSHSQQPHVVDSKSSDY
jgi:hypothetical protein